MEPRTGRTSRKKTTDTAATNPSSAPPETPIDREQIRIRAYALFEQRGGVSGLAWDDWLTAERQLVEERAKGRRSQ